MSFLFTICFIFILSAAPAPGVIFSHSDDAAYNTSAPTGALEGSGWQWQGSWSGGARHWEYLGTPISPHFFVTAKHTGGTTNWTFRYDNRNYTPVQRYKDRSSDLELWKVKETFKSFAPLYDRGDEQGRGCVIFGRGKIRGEEIKTSRLNGWKWGLLDNVMRWGTNHIVSVKDDLMVAEFNGAGDNECALAGKDSSSGVFVKDGAEWKLAGIAYSVFPTRFSLDADGTNAFDAACTDCRGLYYKNGPSWFFAQGAEPMPQRFYMTRISQRYKWILDVIGEDLRHGLIP